MTDIFISYSRRYRGRIWPVVESLRNLSLDVWFDAELQAGDIFSDKIEAHLQAAKCVLVLWTRDAIDKGPRGWVRSEADWALQRDKLIQAKLEPVTLPPPFFSSVARPIDLSATLLNAGKPAAPAWRALLKAVGRYTKRPGLEHLPAAEPSDAELLAWAAKFSSDPLVVDLSGASPISARIRDARHRDQCRIQRRLSLETELRALVDDTRRAPTPYFESSNQRELWPRSETAFAALGLDVNVYGLEFFDLRVERATDGSTPILLVSGEVRNVGRETKAVPPVRISLRDARSHEICDLVNVVTEEPLAAGASTSFEITVENPPANAVDLEATFASHAERASAGGTPPISSNSSYDTELLLTEPADGEAAREAAAADHGEPTAGAGEFLPGLRLRNA